MNRRRLIAVFAAMLGSASLHATERILGGQQQEQFHRGV
jgi:hypothetical protein